MKDFGKAFLALIVICIVFGSLLLFVKPIKDPCPTAYYVHGGSPQTCPHSTR